MTTKPSAEAVKILKNMAKKLDISMPEIKKKYGEVFARKSIQNLKVTSEEERQKHAIRVLMAETVNAKDRSEFSGTAVPVTIRIESKEGISDFKRQGSNEIGYRAGLYVTVKDEGENTALGYLTLWNDACEVHPNLVVGETYSTKCVFGSKDNIWKMSMNESEEVDDSDVELTPLKDIITKNYTAILIEDVENNISKDRDDLKLVEGTVVSGWAKVTANGKDMSFVKIMGDFDSDDSIVAKFSGDANIANSVNSGDLIYILGQTTPETTSQDGSQEYPMGMWGSLVIPILVIKPDEDIEEEEDPDTDIDLPEDLDSETDEIEDKTEDESEDITDAIDGW